MRRQAWAISIGVTVLVAAACEPREPSDPAVEGSTVADTMDLEGPPATTRAASQPPAIPLADLVDTVPEGRP